MAKIVVHIPPTSTYNNGLAAVALKLTVDEISRDDPAITGICSSCVEGKMSITRAAHGKHSESTTVMNCFDCGGTGLVQEEKQRQQILYKRLWCKCESNPNEVIRASDGREVFGNDTYICNGCKKVVQFG